MTACIYSTAACVSVLPPWKTPLMRGRSNCCHLICCTVFEVLALQGVKALLRKAVDTASVHFTIIQPSENELKMEQTATAASIPGTADDYILDYEWREGHDAFFGDIEGRSRWVTQEVARKTGAESDQDVDDDGRKLLNAVGKKPDDAWEATHFVGFEEVDGA